MAVLENVAPVMVQFWPFRSNVPAALSKVAPPFKVNACPVNRSVPAPECVMLLKSELTTPPVLSV